MKLTECLWENIHKATKACLSLPHSCCTNLLNLCVKGSESLSAISPLKAKSYIQSTPITFIGLRLIWWFLFTYILSDFHFLSKGCSSTSGSYILVPCFPPKFPVLVGCTAQDFFTCPLLINLIFYLCGFIFTNTELVCPENMSLNSYH